MKKTGRDRRLGRSREGEVPENLVKRFVGGGRKGAMDDKSFDELAMEHECSDEDCNLCFENCSDDDEYYDDDDYDDHEDDSSEYYHDNCSGKYDLESSRRNDNRVDVDAIIRRCRLESDEAIRKLKEKLDKFNLEKSIKNNTPWLEIIVGAGHHSRKNEQKNFRPN